MLEIYSFMYSLKFHFTPVSSLHQAIGVKILHYWVTSIEIKDMIDLKVYSKFLRSKLHNQIYQVSHTCGTYKSSLKVLLCINQWRPLFKILTTKNYYTNGKLIDCRSIEENFLINQILFVKYLLKETIQQFYLYLIYKLLLCYFENSNI